MLKDRINSRRNIFTKMTLLVKRRKTKETVQEKAKRPFTVGNALKEVLSQAAASDRLVTGTIDCAAILNKDPDQVLLCVLPEARDSNFFMQTHNKLIEAYCRENDIKLIKVDSGEKLASLLPSSGDRSHDGWTTGSECMVVKRPKTLSKEEDFVIAYHDTIVYCDIHPVPLIEIPE